MERSTRIFLFLIWLVVVMAGWAVPALAYQPPVNLDGSYQNGNMYYFWAKDPQLDQWFTDQTDPTAVNTDFASDDGNYIIAWIATKLGKQNVFMVTYDPYRKTIARTGLGPYDAVSGLTVQDGVVSFVSVEGTQRTLRFSTYDPGPLLEGTFKHGSAAVDQNSLMVNQHGVVAWTKYDDVHMSWLFYASVYDPRVWLNPPLPLFGKWVTAVNSPGSYVVINSLTVNSHGTVVAATPTLVYLGYDPDLYQWYGGETKGLSNFVVRPSSGHRPLWVWVTDMSIGATLWAYDFGDKTAVVSNRSGYHIYKQGGNFQLVQGIASLGGLTTSTQTIKVTAPLDFLPLLLLDG